MRTPRSRTQLYTLKDFTGGLNLSADTFKLAENESPDMMNVDVDDRGGFQLRSGVQPYSTSTLSAHPDTLWSYTSTAATYVLAQVGSEVLRSTGTTWTQIGSGLGSSTETVCATTFNNISYWVRGDAAAVKWDSAASSTLGTAFNDTSTPSSGNLPKAKHIAAHAGYLWVAGTYESGVSYPNRVRWSWANTFNNSGENWRSDDYIDIDEGKDSDTITAIVPFGDHLVVFKRDSVYAVYGYSAETFQVVNLSNTVGAISHNCAVNSPAGLFFFDHTNGLNVWDGKSVRWVFEKVWSMMRDKDIPTAELEDIHMGWVHNRLWLSVPWTGEPSFARFYTFVFDPYMPRGGAWMKYDLKCGPYIRNHRDEEHLCAIIGTNLIFKLESGEVWSDNFGPTIGQKPIQAYLRTCWVDLEQPAIKKRWRRMECVLQAKTPFELPVVSYSDYDPSIVKKNFKFIPRGIANPSGGSQWDVATWRGTVSGSAVGNMVWAAEQEQFGEINRGSNLGVARSVSLKIGGTVLSSPSLGTQVPVFWGVDSLIFKFVPRRVR